MRKRYYTPELREKFRLASIEWRKNNKERHNQYNKMYRLRIKSPEKNIRITTVLSGDDIRKFKALLDLEEYGTTPSNFLRLLLQREYDSLHTK